MVTSRITLLLVVALALGRTGLAARCAFKKAGQTGDKEKIRLQLYDCVRASSSSKAACGGSEKVDILLEKGEEKDTGYDVNKYDVLVKFYGKDLCVSFYKWKKFRDYRGVEITEGCETFCTDNAEDSTTYNSDVTCSSISCGGGYYTLKFVVTDSAVVKRVNFLHILLATGISLLLYKLS